MTLYLTGHTFWKFLALTMRTGGITIIIQSAAGIAIMGSEKINFLCYLKHISWFALHAYFADITTFFIKQHLL